jgi:aminopeptidase YwaD
MRRPQLTFVGNTFGSMKKLLLLAVLVPQLVLAQSKKQKKAQEKADKELISNLQSHVQYLADDKLEGRRAGTKGELLAMEYIQKKFSEVGLEPKGSDKYVQAFEINEGKQFDEATTFLKVENKAALLKTDFFPVSFSINKQIKSSTSPSLPEKGEAWFYDVKEGLEENKNNPHFDVNALLTKEVERASQKGATALLVYNSSNITDNIQFDKFSKASITKIPVVYLTKSGAQKFKDATATYDIELGIDLKVKTRQAHNVVGFINNGAANTIIIGAHYDHLGYGEDKNALDGEGQIHNGADDNASGTSGLIELARALKQSKAKSNNYLFIAFSGEEMGLLGSKYWLENQTVKVQPNYMINLDMIGRYDTARKLTVGGYGTSPIWAALIGHADKKNLILKLDSSGTGPSDHASFYRKDIPVLFFFTNSHNDYHKATDDWDKINYTGQMQIIRFIQNIIEQSDKSGKLAFLKTREPEMGRSTAFTVSLGVIPDYAYTGTGMRIDGVSKGKLAEKLGLQPGDILLQLGEYKFVDVQSYMVALSKFKKGDSATLRIQRGKEEKSFDLTF